MPAVSKPISNRKANTALIHDLAAAVTRHDAVPTLPLIAENRISQTRSVHVVVIWDAWEKLSPSDRSTIIHQAYAKAARFTEDRITVAMGLPEEEALRSGLLPYGIITTRREGDRVTLAQLRKAMQSAGGVHVRVGTATHLRFATLEQAEDAYRYLSQAVSGPYWAIINDQGSPD